jgi:mono/diheme cytochrome c family protein
MTTFRRLGLVVAVSLAALASTAAGASPKGVARPAAAPLKADPGPGRVEIWQRQAGKGAEARKDVRAFELDALPLVETRRPDPQYAGWFSYRGVPLQSLLERYAPPAGVDLALLHFANGMQVPFAFRDAAYVGRADVFVARAIRPSPGAAFVVGTFPNISRPREGFVDVRPITFAGNKVVVRDPAHPAVPAAAAGVLSPWMHVDTLTGIELVSAKAYDAQLDVDATVHAGFELFRQSCQFCHGARGVGASFGWDFVDPVPMYTYRGERNLFYHVKYKPLDASARGLLMPALSHMSEEDATAIWRWLRAIATRPTPAYAP